MGDQGLGPGPPGGGKTMPCRPLPVGHNDEGQQAKRPTTTADNSYQGGGQGGGDGDLTDCEVGSVASSITDPFLIDDMADDDVMMRPDRALVYISSSPWTEQGWRLYHHPDDERQEGEEEGGAGTDGEEEEEGRVGAVGPFLRPTTLGQALDLTDQCVFITEVNYPYPVVHANSAFTRLSQYHFHEIARRPCLFLEGPGGQQTAFQEMLEDVAVTGFGRCSVIHYNRRAEPFLNSLSVVPVVNRSYSIPRMTHLLWTCRATFQGHCKPPRYPTTTKQEPGVARPQLKKKQAATPAGPSSSTVSARFPPRAPPRARKLAAPSTPSSSSWRSSINHSSSAGEAVRCSRKRPRWQAEEGAAAAAVPRPIIDAQEEGGPLRRPYLSSSCSSDIIPSSALTDCSSVVDLGRLTSIGDKGGGGGEAGVGGAASMRPSAVLPWPAAGPAQVICV